MTNPLRWPPKIAAIWHKGVPPKFWERWHPSQAKQPETARAYVREDVARPLVEALESIRDELRNSYMIGGGRPVEISQRAGAALAAYEKETT